MCVYVCVHIKEHVLTNSLIHLHLAKTAEAISMKFGQWFHFLM